MALALVTAFAVMALRIGLHLAGIRPEGMDFMLVHFLALVTVIFFSGVRILRKPGAGSFPELLKEGFRTAAAYALALGIFTWVFYLWIDVDHFRLRVDEMVLRGMLEGQPEEIIRPRLEKFFTPFNYATITLFSLLVVSGILSLFIAAVQHKLLRRFRQ